MTGNLATYWADAPLHIIASLESSASGLSQLDAQQRLKRYGENRVTETRGAGVLRLFLRQVASPLVLILIFGACISLAVQQWTDATIILVIVLVG